MKTLIKLFTYGTLQHNDIQKIFLDAFLKEHLKH